MPQPYRCGGALRQGAWLPELGWRWYSVAGGSRASAVLCTRLPALSLHCLAPCCPSLQAAWRAWQGTRLHKAGVRAQWVQAYGEHGESATRCAGQVHAPGARDAAGEPNNQLATINGRTAVNNTTHHPGLADLAGPTFNPAAPSCAASATLQTQQTPPTYGGWRQLARWC